MHGYDRGKLGGDESYMQIIYNTTELGRDKLR